MITISSETELLESFRHLDRDEVTLPPNIRFPLELSDTFSWVEPSGARVYLLYNDGRGKLPKGIVFRRGPAGRAPVMCQWCHAVEGGEGIGLLTATANSKSRVGLHLCRDLRCKEKASSIPGVHDLSEGLSGEEKIRKIMLRIDEFARKCLF